MWAPGYEYLEQALAISDYKLLEDKEITKIFLFEKLNVIVKEYNYILEVEREFTVGMLANSYNSPYLVKTLGYYIRERSGKSYKCIVTEYVPGTHLNLDNPQHAKRLLFIQLLYMIRHLQEEMEFTHYDLHHNNIMIHAHEENSTKKFVFEREQHTLDTPYDVKFIDLMSAHIKGVPSMYFFGRCTIEICPGIFDPLFDLNEILGMSVPDVRLTNILYDDTTLMRLLDKYLSNTIVFPDGDFHMSYLRMNLCTWACHDFTRGKNISQTHHEIVTSILQEFKIDIDELQKLHSQNYIDKFVFDTVCTRLDLVGTYVKMLGEAYAYTKKQQLIQCHLSIQEFFSESIAFINRILPD